MHAALENVKIILCVVSYYKLLDCVFLLRLYILSLVLMRSYITLHFLAKLATTFCTSGFEAMSRFTLLHKRIKTIALSTKLQRLTSSFAKTHPDKLMSMAKLALSYIANVTSFLHDDAKGYPETLI